jgi:HD superfamily phosphodiesterase
LPGESLAGPLTAWESCLKERARPYLLQGRPDDWDHTLRAIEFGKALLKEEKGDPEVVITALVLHDIGWSRVPFDDFVHAPPEKKKETRSLKEHMVQSAVLSREILEPFDFPKDKKELVLKIIAVHDLPEVIQDLPEPEAVLVMEADRLDRFGEKSLNRYRKMFGENYLREGRRFLLEGSKTWFRTPTARRLVQELLAKTGSGDRKGEASNI